MNNASRKHQIYDTRWQKQDERGSKTRISFKDRNKGDYLKRFSIRKGIKTSPTLQRNSMDVALRTSLWNAIDIKYLSFLAPPQYNGGYSTPTDYFEEIRGLVFLELWYLHFKWPMDQLNGLNWTFMRSEVRDYFFTCEWYEVYDLIEYLANKFPDTHEAIRKWNSEEYSKKNNRFMEMCNAILEEEVSAYRFVGGKITEIVTSEEIAEIEEALEVPINTVREHLKCALELFADRHNPDYRNSIKESISAVEALCQKILQDDNATLGKALQRIEIKAQVVFPTALKGAFEKIYGYSSSANGIRHALSEEPTVNSEDARFMLITCSAFVNYLLEKARKAEIAF